MLLSYTYILRCIGSIIHTRRAMETVSVRTFRLSPTPAQFTPAAPDKVGIIID